MNSIIHTNGLHRYHLQLYDCTDTGSERTIRPYLQRTIVPDRASPVEPLGTLTGRLVFTHHRQTGHFARAHSPRGREGTTTNTSYTASETMRPLILCDVAVRHAYTDTIPPIPGSQVITINGSSTNQWHWYSRTLSTDTGSERTIHRASRSYLVHSGPYIVYAAANNIIIILPNRTKSKARTAS